MTPCSFSHINKKVGVTWLWMHEAVQLPWKLVTTAWLGAAEIFIFYASISSRLVFVKTTFSPSPDGHNHPPPSSINGRGTLTFVRSLLHDARVHTYTHTLTHTLWLGTNKLSLTAWCGWGIRGCVCLLLLSLSNVGRHVCLFNLHLCLFIWSSIVGPCLQSPLDLMQRKHMKKSATIYKIYQNAHCHLLDLLSVL